MIGQRRECWRAWAALVLAVGCGACSPGFSIDVSSDWIGVKLTLKRGLSLHFEPCVYQLEVREEQWPNRRHVGTVWKITARDKCVKLSSIRVGQTPVGFVSEINHLPLKPGHMYGAVASAQYGEHSRYSGGMLPWFICRTGVVSIGWKDEHSLEDPPAGCLP